jgi:Lon protease-like protein
LGLLVFGVGWLVVAEGHPFAITHRLACTKMRCFHLLTLITVATSGVLAFINLRYWNRRSIHTRKLSALLLTSKNVEELLRESVDYFDASKSPIMQGNSKTSRILPLFLHGSAFYPEGVTYLHIYEMKYRMMMYDVAKKDDLFGLINFNSATGQIASIGTLCKIIGRHLLEDGCQLISLQGISRFQLNRIESTLPYHVADVTTELEDSVEKDMTMDEIGEMLTLLESETYSNLKFYMRMLKCYPNNAKIVLSSALQRNRPVSKLLPSKVKNQYLFKSFSDSQQENQELMPSKIITPYSWEEFRRQSRFSFALTSMIQMTNPTEAQLLLQTTSLRTRLEVLNRVLAQACRFVPEDLQKHKLKDSMTIELVRAQSFNPHDDDLDIINLEAPNLQHEEYEEEDIWAMKTLQ